MGSEHLAWAKMYLSSVREIGNDSCSRILGRRTCRAQEWRGEREEEKELVEQRTDVFLREKCGMS